MSRFWKPGNLALATPTLQILALSSDTFPENSAAGTVIGSLLNTTAGSALALTDDQGGRLALVGNQLQVGATNTNFEATPTLAPIVTETLAGATGSPNPTTLAVNVTNVFEAATLAALGFSSTTFVVGTPSSGTITGATVGSTITVGAAALPTGLTIDGPGRTWAWDGTGGIATSSFTLVETLADSANSPRTSTINYTIGVAGATLTTPVLALTSASNTIPVSYSVTLGADIYEGFYLEGEFATDAAFTAITQTYEHVVTSDEVAAGVIHLDSGTGNENGISDPSGPTYYHRVSWLREDGAFSNKSNTVTDTINISTAALTTTTGTNKSANVNVSGSPALNYALSAGGGAPTYVKANQGAAHTKFHVEVLVTALNATPGFVLGVTDSAQSLSGTPALGSGATPGAAITMTASGSTSTFNGGAQGSQAIGGIAVGDYVIMEVDTVANTVRWGKLRGATLTWGATRTLTSNIPSAYWVAVGGLRSSDAGTINYGGQPYAVTPNTGFNNFYA